MIEGCPDSQPVTITSAVELFEAPSAISTALVLEIDELGVKVNSFQDSPLVAISVPQNKSLY